MNFVTSVKTGIENTFNFKGRASRSEYWYFIFFTALILIAAVFVDKNVLGPHNKRTLSENIGIIVISIPSLSIAMRRLHDCNRRGWWVLLNFVPFVGAIALIILLCGASTVGNNRFGTSRNYNTPIA